MIGATDTEMSSTIINCLDTKSIDKIMLHLPGHCWMYNMAKQAIVKEFGNSDVLVARKTNSYRLRLKLTSP